MKVFRSLARQMLAIIIFATLIFLFWYTEDEGQMHETYERFNEGWTLETNGTVTEYEELPKASDTAGTGQVILKKQLKDIPDSCSSIGFYTSHQLIDVYIGEKQVYRLYPQKLTTSKTPGNLWNFIRLDQPDTGKEITVIVTNCYGKGDVRIPSFYLGAKDSIMVCYIKEQLPAFLISFVIFLVGIMLVTVYFCIRNTMAVSEGALWLGMFAIPLAVWSAMECQFITFFTNRVLLMNQITFAVLKLIPIPILQFVDTMYGPQTNKFLRRLCQISMMDFWGTSILQLLGWVDYKESLWITHIIFIVSACYVLILSIRLLFDKRKQLKEHRWTFLIHGVCVGIVSACVLLDVLGYYFGNRLDSARFSRLGLMIYIIVLAILILKSSVRLIRAGQEVHVIRQESETDSMTKLKNRRSFEKDLYAVPVQELEEYGIIIFDLNNLKKFNDLYGHSMGDYYIIISSEMMQDLFGIYGTIYRIGGDEFCGIVKNIDRGQVEFLHLEMCQKLQALSSGARVKDPMEVAIGFARFDRELDGNLSDTMERADACMYQKKKEMKETVLPN